MKISTTQWQPSAAKSRPSAVSATNTRPRPPPWTVNSTQRTVENYDQQLAQLEREYDALRSAKVKLEAKLATTKQEKDELQALMDLARAKEISNKAMRSLDDLAGAGDADVARVADAVRARLDKASAESEMLASSLDKQMDDVLERGEIDAALIERKRRLGLAEG